MAQKSLPTLQNGSNGEAVRFLQQLLIVFGKLGNSDFDAIFGSKTESAVKEFQREQNLTVDGKVGPQTWGALGNQTKNTCAQF
ncbi:MULTISPECIES: peptidoglycan-binding domain-containing protein [Nostocales]|uniref:Peptidoglycan-binding protein n=3 Tax=Nostocales TaxID=1161 RepID=A0A0C1R2E2_9CYAN|nr:peptidoglycan-binding domain-containing protein [Tolypothrix bouteillei]KAF3884735.1 peptidoglycan-binding protein [Tolypothrix bouteillei VB521301]